MRIGRINSVSATLSTTLTATEDLLCTIGRPTSTDNLLPPDSLHRSALAHRSQMSFDGPGGVATNYRAEFLRASCAVTGDIAKGVSLKMR